MPKRLKAYSLGQGLRPPRARKQATEYLSKFAIGEKEIADIESKFGSSKLQPDPGSENSVIRTLHHVDVAFRT